VLPAVNRMRRSSDFASVVSSGVRIRGGALVVHQRRDLVRTEVRSGAPLVGFVVGRSVGGSVQRHQVSRRLRAQMAQRLDRLPAGSGTVVRALPPAAALTAAQLGAGLDHALAKLAGRQ
jgi:ribonuclease P protein component